MSTLVPENNEVRREPEPIPFAEDMAELSLLLPGAQASALEQAARAQGLTVGEMLRRLVRNFLLGVQRLGQCDTARQWA